MTRWIGRLTLSLAILSFVLAAIIGLQNVRLDEHEERQGLSKVRSVDLSVMFIMSGLFLSDV